jgi:dTDP-4-amino-4,6-dideoxygalactose transaminase
MIPRFCPELTGPLLKELLARPYVPGSMEEYFQKIFTFPSAIGLASGREALFHALCLGKIGPGDEVIIPSLNCSAVSDAVLATGATPVLANVLENCTIDPSQLDKLYSDKTKAVIAVHFNGVPCRLAELRSWCNIHRMLLIEDVAQALGAIYENRWVGSFGDFAVFSFAFDKHITAGGGGILVVNNLDYIASLDKLQSQGHKPNIAQENQVLQSLERNLRLYQPNNYRFGRIYQRFSQKLRPAKPLNFDVLRPRLMGDRQSALILGQLEHLKQWNANRLMRCEWYRNGLDLLPAEIQPLTIDNDSVAIPLRYTLRMNAAKRVRVARALLEQGIETGPFIYSAPLHLKSEVANNARFLTGQLSESEILAKELLNLPIHPHVTPKIVEKIMNVIVQA